MNEYLEAKKRYEKAKRDAEAADRWVNIFLVIYAIAILVCMIGVFSV